MKLSKIGKIIGGQVWAANEKLDWGARGMLVSMMLLVNVDVVGRFVFSKSFSGGYELNELMMVFVVFLSLGYCTVQRGVHISMEIVFSRLSRHTQAVLNSVTSFASLSLFCLIAWQLIMRGSQELVSPSGSVTTLLRAPVAPFVLVAGIGSVAVCAALLVNLFHYLAEATGSCSNLNQGEIK